MAVTWPELYFIRHGETDWNVDARLQGQRDIPINANGRGQAAEAGRRLASVLPEPDSLPWVVSPMSRTRETAEIARAAIGLPPGRYGMDDRLKELTFGEWEGKTWRDLRSVDAAAVEARFHNKWDFVPPGKGAESYQMLLERVRPFFEALRRPTVCVTHGGVIRALFRMVENLPKPEAARVDTPQDRILRLKDDRLEWL